MQKRIRLWMFLEITIALLTMIIGCGENVNQITTGFVDYEDSDMGIEVDYPEGWSVHAKEAPGVMSKVIFEGADGTTCSVIAESLQSGVTLEQYLEQLKDIYENFGVYEYEENEVALGSQPAKQIKYNMMNIDGSRLTNREIYTIRDDKVYSVGCSSLEDKYTSYEEIFQHFIVSFGFI
jgi:hypothetical protein